MNHCKACAAGGQCTSNEGYVARFGLVRHTEKQEPKCNPHPKAPHGFNRNASHANDRYTCECEGWDAYDAGYQAGVMAGIETAMGEEQKQEPVATSTSDLRKMLDIANHADPSRWEIGFRNIVAILYGSRHKFEIKDVVEHVRELSTSPPQRQPLTRGQIREIEIDVSLNPSFDYITPAEQLCRAIEAAHGIKE